MGAANGGDGVDVILIETPGGNARPMLLLHGLGLPDMGIAGEEACRFRHGLDAGVERVERMVERADDDLGNFRHPLDTFGIQADEIQSFAQLTDVGVGIFHEIVRQLVHPVGTRVTSRPAAGRRKLAYVNLIVEVTLKEPLMGAFARALFLVGEKLGRQLSVAVSDGSTGR